MKTVTFFCPDILVLAASCTFICDFDFFLRSFAKFARGSGGPFFRLRRVTPRAAVNKIKILQ